MASVPLASVPLASIHLASVRLEPIGEDCVQRLQRQRLFFATRRLTKNPPTTTRIITWPVGYRRRQNHIMPVLSILWCHGRKSQLCEFFLQWCQGISQCCTVITMILYNLVYMGTGALWLHDCIWRYDCTWRLQRYTRRCNKKWSQEYIKNVSLRHAVISAWKIRFHNIKNKAVLNGWERCSYNDLYEIWSWKLTPPDGPPSIPLLNIKPVPTYGKNPTSFG